jgi:serine/threonine protein kinase
MDHPNIVKLYEAFVEKDHLHLLMELMTGGELFDRLEKKKDYNEKDAIVIFQQIVAAVSCR